jgi:excisionase family DNA binding protein
LTQGVSLDKILVNLDRRISMEQTEAPTFLKPSQVAKNLGLSRAKVYSLISMGQIPSVKIAGSIRVPTSVLSDLEERAKAPR